MKRVHICGKTIWFSLNCLRRIRPSLLKLVNHDYDDNQEQVVRCLHRLWFRGVALAYPRHRLDSQAPIELNGGCTDERLSGVEEMEQSDRRRWGEAHPVYRVDASQTCSITCTMVENNPRSDFGVNIERNFCLQRE